MNDRALWDTLSAAEARGDTPIVAALEAVSSPEVIHAAWILSIVLAIDRGALVGVLGSLWNEDHDHGAAVEELLEWPFIDMTMDGYRLNDVAASDIRSAFFEGDPVRFREAHKLLASLEERLEADSDPEESWFIRGRVAYYLAGYDDAASVETFGANFASPPLLERTEARMWLSWLATRQESLLVDRSRELSFFRGFRCYILGQRDHARREFDAVIGRGERDRYEAFATHFAGILHRGRRSGNDVELLESSIALSEELRLLENEVMARQSLVTALVVRSDPGDLESARSLANLNLTRAVDTADPYLVRWCTGSAANVEWLYLTDKRAAVTPSARREAPRILESLKSVASEALIDDPETSLIAVNDAASIFRDLGQWELALAEIRQWLLLAAKARIPEPAFQRLAKTAGSLFRLAPKRGHQAIHDVLVSLDERMPNYRQSRDR